MATATATAIVGPSVFLGKDRSPASRRELPLGSDPVRLSLSDILPNITPTAEEDRGSWRSLGELNGGIVKRLAIQRGSKR